MSNITVTVKDQCWYCAVDVNHFHPTNFLDAPRIIQNTTSNGEPLYHWDGSIDRWPVCKPCALQYGVEHVLNEDPFE